MRSSLQPALVLLVAKVRAGGHAYYLEPTGVNGGRAVEAPGRWVGRGAPVLGLHGPVTPESLEAVLSGTDPEGVALPGAARARVTVAGFDLTFCAPKSVSILHGLSEPEVSEAVAAGHGRAVDAGVAYLEDHALAVRRRSPDAPRVPVPAEGAPAAAFAHRTSRALDPHVHTHVVLANLGRGPDGSWSALDGRGVYAHAGAAGAVYQAQLRYELTAALGVGWGPLHHGRADISGIEIEARRAFSRRSEQIAAHLAARGLGGGDDGPPVSRRASWVAGLTTRAERDLTVGAEELRPQWRARAREAGIGPRRLESVLDRVSARAPAVDGRARAENEAFDGAAVAGALAGVRHPDRAFSRRDVVRAWSGSLPEGAPSPEVAAVADRFMEEVATASGHRWAPDGRGVAESRAELPEHLRRRELELLLQRRGISFERDCGRSLAIDRGIGLG